MGWKWKKEQGRIKIRNSVDVICGHFVSSDTFFVATGFGIYDRDVIN